MRRNWVVGCLALGVIVVAGCGRKYWEPVVAEREQAERIARYHVYLKLSDQARAGRAEPLPTDPVTGLPKEYPIAFTIGGTPYARYRIKHWGGIQKGVKWVHVLYFEATKISDWESPDASGTYPDFFSVAVDLAGRTARTDE